MKGKVIAGVVASLLLFGALPSQASSLVDYGSYTVDTSTGLQWLDVSTTFGRTYNDVSANLSNNLDVVYGYHYATGAELAQLIADAGVTTAPPCGPCSPTPALTALIGYLGQYTTST